MDNMTVPELQIILQNIVYANADEWNQTRQIMMYCVAPYLKKQHMTPHEFYPLPSDDVPKLTKEVSNEEVEWFKKFQAEYKKGSN